MAIGFLKVHKNELRLLAIFGLIYFFIRLVALLISFSLDKSQNSVKNNNTEKHADGPGYLREARKLSSETTGVFSFIFLFFAYWTMVIIAAIYSKKRTIASSYTVLDYLFAVFINFIYANIVAVILGLTIGIYMMVQKVFIISAIFFLIREYLFSFVYFGGTWITFNIIFLLFKSIQAIFGYAAWA